MWEETAVAVMDAAQRQKVVEGLMRKAEDLLRQMRQEAETGNVDAVERMALALAEVLKAREIPSQRGTEYREQGKACQRNACQRSVETLLLHAERLAHAGDDQGRNDALTKAKAHFAMTIRFGADDEYRAAVERRVQAVLLTTAGGVDQRTKEAAERKLKERDRGGSKAPGGVERRRAIRYAEPVLTVQIGERSYCALNWSIRGLLIGGYGGELGLSVGDRVRLDLSCELQPTAIRQPARVVRIDEPPATLAVAFPDISTVVLEMMRAMKAADTPAEPE